MNINTLLMLQSYVSSCTSTHIMPVYALVRQEVSISYVTMCMGLQGADLHCNITVQCWKWETTEGKTTALGRAELEAKLVGIFFFFPFITFLHSTLRWSFLVIDFMTFKM